jgi:hypothetical protein
MSLFRRNGHSEPSVSDERSYARIRLVLNVLCRQGGRDLRLFTDDVSEAGIRFVSQDPLVPESEAMLLMPLEPHQPPIPMRGRVAWIRQEGESQYSGGISFLELEPDERAAWSAFIERNRAATS